MYREVVRIPTDARPVDNAAVDIDLVLDGHEQYLADAKHHSEDYVADVCIYCGWLSVCAQALFKTF
jgi:hypothetical protein